VASDRDDIREPAELVLQKPWCRLPMVEVDPQTPLSGADGLVSLIDIFDGRSQLIAYFDMWHTGRPAA